MTNIVNTPFIDSNQITISRYSDFMNIMVRFGSIPTFHEFVEWAKANDVQYDLAHSDVKMEDFMISVVEPNSLLKLRLII